MSVRAAILLLLAFTVPVMTEQTRNVSFQEVLNLPVPPADHRITYGAAPQQFGELRLPRNSAGPHPVVLLVHGGCWQGAYDITHSRPLAAAIADAGYAVWSVEYRRLGQPGGGWPGTFDDVAAGADHLRTLAPRHNLDLTRVNRRRSLGRRTTRVVARDARRSGVAVAGRRRPGRHHGPGDIR